MPQKEKPTGLTAALIGALILVAFPISIFLFIQSNLLGSDAIIIGTGFSSNWLLIRLIALSIWAFIVAADERALGPLVFHEPLVASSIAGLLLGHFQSGVLCGLIFQAIWPGLQPMGGSLQPMAGISAIISLLWYISWSGFLGPLIFPVALAVALLAAHVSDRAEILARKRNETRTRRILDNPDKITDKKLFGLVQIGLAEAGLVGPAFLFFFAGLPLIVVVILDLISSGQIFSSSTAFSFDFLAQFGFAEVSTGASIGMWEYLVVVFALGGFFGLHGQAWFWQFSRLRQFSKASLQHTADSDPSRSDHSHPDKDSTQNGLTFRRFYNALTLQACFSNLHLQRAGFLNLLSHSPGATASKRSMAEYSALREQAVSEGVVNTNPVMSVALIGAVDRILLSATRADLPRSPMKLLSIGGSLLAQWGDRLFWGGLRPFLSLLIIALLPLGSGAAITAFLFLGLLMHISGRWLLYHWGWRAGWQVAHGGKSSFWQLAPLICQLILPWVGLIAAFSLVFGSERFFYFGQDISGRSLYLTAVWFILGILFGRAHSTRPILWGIICWFAGAVGLAAGTLSGIF